MSERKISKHDYSARLKYIRLLESGWTFWSIRVKYGFNDTQLKVLWEKYLQYGKAGLRKSGRIKADFALKKKIVLDITENHLTLHAASIKYGPCPDAIKKWLRIFRAEGLSGLKRIKKQGRPPGMGRPRKNSRPMTELERLRKENQELKTENALLKKVRALVEERNARLRAIGQEPSKN